MGNKDCPTISPRESFPRKLAKNIKKNLALLLPHAPSPAPRSAVFLHHCRHAPPARAPPCAVAAGPMQKALRTLPLPSRHASPLLHPHQAPSWLAGCPPRASRPLAASPRTAVMGRLPPLPPPPCCQAVHRPTACCYRAMHHALTLPIHAPPRPVPPRAVPRVTRYAPPHANAVGPRAIPLCPAMCHRVLMLQD